MPKDKCVSAGAVIRKGDHYLLICNPHGTWGFPKGRMEEGESVEQTAVREVKEEVGLDVVLHGSPALMTYTMPNGKNKRVYLFLADMDCDQQVHVDGKEVINYQWVSEDDACEVLTFASARKIFQEITKHQ